MPTLNQITKETKSIIKWGIIVLVLIILIFFGIKIGGILKEMFFPTPAPAPTVTFGKLPQVAFPKNAKNYNLTYSIDTLTGKLPQFSDRVNVYKMVYEKPDLLSFQRAKEKAGAIGFTSAPTTVSEGVYQWTNSSSIGKKFILSTLTSSFNLDSNFYGDAKIISGQHLPSKGDAIDIAGNFLSSLSMLPNDIDNTKTKTTLFSIKNYVLIPVTNILDAQLIRVDFFQEDIDKTPMFYSNPDTSNITVYVTGGDDSQIVKADYFHQEMSKDSATYPIKTAQQAYDDLQNGKAFFAYVPTNQEEITIKDVILGYFAPAQNQDYLMPVIVFVGKDGFFAYVSAVTDEWTNN
jgi:hypothetical protein